MWPQNVQLLLADAAAIKVRLSAPPKRQRLRCSSIPQEVASQRLRFLKPVSLYQVINIYGDNLISAEGDQWKGFRKIIAPAFSEVPGRFNPK